MKTKLNLVIISLTSLLFIFVYHKITNKNFVRPNIAATNVIKCTSTNFLLDNIDSTRQIAPLFGNLGKHTFKIKTTIPQAQTFFNQGLNLAFAFNHAESHRSFMESSRLDPGSAMSYWGQAYVLGPNINDQIPDSQRKIKSYEAIDKAMKLRSDSSPIEEALIVALSKRYSADTLADIKKLNMDYMRAMKTVAEEYKNNEDVLTLYAASIMNTVPWNYWDKDGNPSPNIKEAKLALEKAILLNSEHPGAHHYYIHMVELPKPDLAVPSAEMLATLMPGAGHMVHMPGHIYMRVGRYHEAVEANQKAILVDEDYISQCYSQGLYPLGYYPHNIHFLWSAASMMGNQKMAIQAAKKTAEKVPLSDLEDNKFFQNFAATPLLAYMRFGKWNEILTTPDPGLEYTYLRMIWNYSRGIAFVRKNNLKEAKEELAELDKRDMDLEHENISKVAYEVLAGEIEALQGNWSKAITHLQQGVKFEDELPYDEPSVWYIPSRQSLGSVLLKAKEYAEAERIFLEDLEYYRQNGWSLMGLYQSLKKQEKWDKAEKVKKEFDIAWKRADIQIDSAVF